MPTTRIDSDGDGREHCDQHVERADRDARDARALLVEHRRDERPEQERDHPERRAAEHGDEGEVGPRDGQDRAEQEREEIDVERSGSRDEHDAGRDPRVEDERESLVARGPLLRVEPLDGNGAHERGNERGQNGRQPEQVPGRDPGEGEVADPVADQAHPPLHEEEADGRGEDAVVRARRERVAHELRVKDGSARGGA
jgi:hypothetical protein